MADYLENPALTDPGGAEQRPTADISIRHQEILLAMTTRMLATHRVDELMSLVLDTITANLGYRRAAIALIDERSQSLGVRMAVGFPDNSAIEGLEIPLDSAGQAVSVIYDGQAVWIGNDVEFFGQDLSATEQILALPLFGVRVLEESKAEFALRQFGHRKHWEPQAICSGVLYICADPNAVDSESMNLLQRLAYRLGAILASAVQTERLISLVDALQRERQWVESVMQSAADPVVLTNLDNEILLQNRRAEELFSGSDTAGEAKRRALKMNDLLFSAYLSSGAVASAEMSGRDITLVDPIEGTDIHFEVISTPAVDECGERIGVVSVFRDVTDLREANEQLARNYRRLLQAEAEARRERDRLNLTIENVGHPVVLTDSSGNFVLFNRRAARLFQEEPLSVGDASAAGNEQDRSITRSLVAVRSNLVKMTSFISGLAPADNSGREVEIQLLDPETGQSLPMEITSVEVVDQNGQLAAVVSVLHDLSEIRELELRRLEQKIFESEKLAAVGTLAASIAHEVNNPLEAIKNSLYLLQSSKDQASTGRFLSVALKETERVSTIIRQMLGFARYSGGLDWVSLNQLIKDILPLIGTKLRHEGIRIVENFDQDLPLIHAHPDQLRQVFLNLILNAEQSIEGRGRIEITTSPHPKSVQPSVLVEISDTGTGFDEDDLTRLFEPFFSTRKDGTGLGLWVTQNIVRQHGGRIEAANRLGGGATFRLILPVDSSAAMAADQQ